MSIGGDSYESDDGKDHPGSKMVINKGISAIAHEMPSFQIRGLLFHMCEKLGK